MDARTVLLRSRPRDSSRGTPAFLAQHKAVYRCGVGRVLRSHRFESLRISGGGQKHRRIPRSARALSNVGQQKRPHRRGRLGGLSRLMGGRITCPNPPPLPAAAGRDRPHPQCVEEGVDVGSLSPDLEDVTDFVVSNYNIKTYRLLGNPSVCLVDSTSSARRSGEPLVSGCPSDWKDLSALSAMSADRTPQPSRRRSEQRADSAR